MQQGQRGLWQRHRGRVQQRPRFRRAEPQIGRADLGELTWLPLGIRDRLDSAAADEADLDDDIRLAFGDAAKGTTGFLAHPPAGRRRAGGRARRGISRAAGGGVQPGRARGDDARIRELLRAWVLATLAGLATDDEHHARLRDTLLAFLRSGGSYKATAEQLTLHKNTVQYRVRKAVESLGQPLDGYRNEVELALQASHWLGSDVLRQGSR